MTRKLGYSVEYNRAYESRGLPWMLRKYAASGDNPPLAHYASEDEAHREGKLWNTTEEDSQMTVLVFDTETTGLPFFTEPSDAPNQPHIVQLAAELCDNDGNVLESYQAIVNIGVPIPAECTAIHGITDEIARDKGIPPKQMLADFYALVDKADTVVAHNAGFDIRMVRIQAARHFGEKWDCPKPVFDTCVAASPIIKLPGTGRWKHKKPNLGECMRYFFNEDIANAHTADADTTACRRVYFAIKALNDGVAPVGHNKPPEQIDAPADAMPAGDPFTTIEIDVNDLYDEMKLWLDGQPIESQAQANDVATLIDRMAKAGRAADAARETEKKPHLEAGRAVDAKYKPLISKAETAVSVAKKAQTKFLVEQKAETQRLADLAAKRAREEAAAAVAAVKDANEAGDLSARESAEDLISQAQSSLGEAKMLGGLKAQAKGEGATRALGLRTVYRPVLTDATMALRHYWGVPDRRAEIEALALDMARKDVRAGARSIPGFTIEEDQVV